MTDEVSRPSLFVAVIRCLFTTTHTLGAGLFSPIIPTTIFSVLFSLPHLHMTSAPTYLLKKGGGGCISVSLQMNQFPVRKDELTTGQAGPERDKKKGRKYFELVK